MNMNQELLEQAKREGCVLVAAANHRIAELWAKRNGVTRQQFRYAYNHWDLFRLHGKLPLFVETSLWVADGLSIRRLKQEIRDRVEAGLLTVVEVSNDDYRKD
ncbi:MAG: hypothetical protein WC196_07115 [Bacilli bacterium]|jgi:hypothetical protein